MADNIATVNLLGLSEVKDYFSDKRIKKAVAIGLAKFTLEVHSVLRTAVHNRYTGNQDLDMLSNLTYTILPDAHQKLR